MTETLNPATFDIADMFSGVNYPTEVVPFYTNPGVAYEFNKLALESKDAVERKDQSAAEDIVKRREKLIEDSEKFRYEIHLRGQSRDNRKAVAEAVNAEFPPGDPDLFGRREPNAEGEEAYVNRYWALHIEKIVAPNGAIKAVPSEADIKALRGNAPDSEIDKVEKAIQELTEGAKSGFESLAQEHDFLSSASPEA